MNKNVKIIKFNSNTFKSYGLDKNKNFIQAPMCECRCGSKCNIILENKEEILGFMFEILMNNDCEHCGIFAHGINCEYIALKVENETDEPIMFLGTEGTDKNVFSEIDKEFQLHCYGLIVETKIGEWEVIEH